MGNVTEGDIMMPLNEMVHQGEQLGKGGPPNRKANLNVVS